MGGLEEIIRQIKIDAESEAKEILDKANDTCDSIRKEAIDEIEKIEKAGTKKADSEAKLALEKIISAAQMESKQEILKTKQAIISDIIEKAYDRISSLPDKEYFDALLNIVEKYAQPSNGRILLNQKDLDRIPADFEEQANKIAGDKKGSLAIGEDAADIENGLILDYGDIEENCTFRALFNNKKDVLQDQINALLFK